MPALTALRPVFGQRYRCLSNDQSGREKLGSTASDRPQKCGSPALSRWHASCGSARRDAGGMAMYLETVDHFAGVAVARSAFLKRSPGGFWISAMMAGAYVGLGIILIFSVGSDVDAG